MRHKEESIQIALSKYIKLKYPKVYFTSESSGLRVPIGTAKKMKSQRSRHKQLDMIILEPRKNYHALIIELKKDAKEVYKNNGDYRKSQHIQEQLESINFLKDKGYFATFGCGYKNCIDLINWYMS